MVEPARPRIEPLSRDEYLQLRARLGSELVSPVDAGLHISRTWAVNPALMMAQTPLQKFFTADSALPPRIREIAILRTGWACRAGYEFAQHMVFGQQAGLTDDEIARLARADLGPDWTAYERAVIDCVDDVHATQQVSDATWTTLAQHLGPPQLIELLALVGRYWTVAIMTKSVGVELEDGVALAPWEAPR